MLPLFRFRKSGEVSSCVEFGVGIIDELVRGGRVAIAGVGKDCRFLSILKVSLV